MSNIPKDFKNKIIRAIRKLSYSWKPRNEAKKLAQIGPAVFVCAKCKCVVYEGIKNLLDATLWDGTPVHKSYQIMKAERGRMDHIKPVVDPHGTFTTWDDYMEGMFCPVENWQFLCLDCDKEKTAEEAKLRKQSRLLNKKIPK